MSVILLLIISVTAYGDCNERIITITRETHPITSIRDNNHEYLNRLKIIPDNLGFSLSIGKYITDYLSLHNKGYGFTLDLDNPCMSSTHAYVQIPKLHAIRYTSGIKVHDNKITIVGDNMTIVDTDYKINDKDKIIETGYLFLYGKHVIYCSRIIIIDDLQLNHFGRIHATKEYTLISHYTREINSTYDNFDIIRIDHNEDYLRHFHKNLTFVESKIADESYYHNSNTYYNNNIGYGTMKDNSTIYAFTNVLDYIKCKLYNMFNIN